MQAINLMDDEFAEQIIKKAHELKIKAEKLPEIEIKWNKPFEFQCNDLLFDGNINNQCSVIQSFINCLKNDLPAIYYFEILSEHSQKTIIEKIRFYKKNAYDKNNNDVKRRSICKIPKKNDENFNNEPNSRCLYCGSIKIGLHKRFKEHLGFGNESTYSLQLVHWAKDIILRLNFHYAYLEKNKEYTELLEEALTDYLNPLLGKH